VLFQYRDILFARISRVGVEGLTILGGTSTVQVVTYLVQHRLHLAHIVRLIGHIGGDENLLFVHRSQRDSALVSTLI